jgi:hypothetical protein
MRPDRTTPRLVALFRDQWPGMLAPKRLILEKLNEREDQPTIPGRTFEHALAKAVDQGDLFVVKSFDGGALYCLGSYARASPVFPTLAASIKEAPFRSLQSSDEVRQDRALRRMRLSDARSGAHDYRYDPKMGRWYNCIACGFVNGRYAPCRVRERVEEYVRTHPPAAGVQTPGNAIASPANSAFHAGKRGT